MDEDFTFTPAQLKTINEFGFSVDHVTNVEQEPHGGYKIVSFCDHQDVDAGLIFCAFISKYDVVVDVVHSSEI